jgi:hypothetical protein
MPLIDTNASHLDKLGYYEVDGHKHLHKLTAYHHAGQDWSQVRFNYNDNIFGAYDWTCEPRPGVPLTEFYKERAQQLRHKYDYLILMFSGGPDSKNMLDVFINNNIFIDEIVCIHSYDKTQVHEGTIHNADWLFNSKPSLDLWIKDHDLKSRITVVDEIDLAKQYLKSLGDRGDYELAFGSAGFASQCILKGTWVKHVPHIWQMILGDKSVGVVMGCDKPRILLDHLGRYYTDWFDIALVDSHLALSEDPDLACREIKEHFYHSPDCVDLIAKQLHVLKNFMEIHRQEEFYYTPDPNKRMAHTCHSKYNRQHLTYQTYHKLIYPKWNPAIITVKTPDYGSGGRPQDNWWLTQFTRDEAKFWVQVTQKVSRFKNMKPLFSKSLYLE